MAAMSVGSCLSSLSLAPLGRLGVTNGGGVISISVLRTMSYFSGSHYDMDHMREAKNTHLPKVRLFACKRPFGTSIRVLRLPCTSHSN